MKKLLTIVGIAALIAPLAVIADSHEEAEPASLASVWVVVPKRGMEGDFVEAAEAHMAFRVEAGDSRNWNAYVSVVGHHINVYQWRASFSEWGEQDAYNAEAAEKGLGEHWNENVDQYVDHYHRYIDVFDFDNSHWPEGGGNGPLYGVTTWHWKPGVGSGPRQAMEKLSEIGKTSGWTDTGANWLWHRSVGGKPTLKLVTSFADYADMAPPEQSFFEHVAEQLGGAEEASELFKKFGAGFSGSDYTVWLHVPDLSTPSEEE